MAAPEQDPRPGEDLPERTSGGPDPMCAECCTDLVERDVLVQLVTNGVFDGQCEICWRETNVPAPAGVPYLSR